MSSVQEETQEPSSKKRAIVLDQTRDVIFKVYKYLQKLLDGKENLFNAVVEATGYSKSTVVRVVREKTTSEPQPTTSKQKVERPCRKSSVDNFGEEVIRRIIHNCHITEKQKPTIKCVYNKIKDDESIGFIGSRASFRRLLLKMGFRWKKTTDNRKALMERHDIRALRSSYMRKLVNYRSQGRPIIYTDETYIHASHTTPFEWVDDSNKGLRCPISKGKRLIVVHAGGETGFIEDALLIFKSGQKSGDYHDDMNYVNYKKWLETALIPNLPTNSVVVMDNASYHNVLAVKHPSANTKKADMMRWLDERGIMYDMTYTKPELYNLIKINKPNNTQFSIDAIFAEHGHVVLIK